MQWTAEVTGRDLLNIGGMVIAKPAMRCSIQREPYGCHASSVVRTDG